MEFRPHTRPCRNCRTAEVDHRGFGNRLCMEKQNVSFIHLLSLKNAFRARLPSKLHRQLLHQHHLQWGIDSRVTNHNGIPSATHPPAPLAVPCRLRERSYSYKSQWNSIDRKCTKHRWNPIYNTEPIGTQSENNPTTHETLSQRSHRRGRSCRCSFGGSLARNAFLRDSRCTKPMLFHTNSVPEPRWSTSAVRQLRDGLVCNRIILGSCSDWLHNVNGISPVFRAFTVDRIPLWFATVGSFPQCTWDCKWCWWRRCRWRFEGSLARNVFLR